MSATGTALEKRIAKDLNKVPGCRAVRHHGDSFTESGEPDIYGCYGGAMFVIEVKSGSATLSEKQEYCLNEWAEAGAYCQVAREDFEVENFLHRLLHVWQDRYEFEE